MIISYFNPPLFSIVIPAYNYAHSLARALESVLNQEEPNYEVLVINDGSTDSTEEIIETLHRQYGDKFASITRNNSGLAATRNFGIDNTRGEWLLFLDADDELIPGALKVLEARIKEKSQARMIIGGHTSVESDGKERYRSITGFKYPGTAEDKFTGYLLNKTITPSNGCTAMHRSIFKHCRYPEQFRNSEDIPVFAYALANFECYELDEPINRIYKHNDSLRHNLEYAEKVNYHLIDTVFDKSRIPEYLQKYRQAYAAKRYLSLFRTFYVNGRYSQAIKHYVQALKFNWKSVFELSYTKKFIQSLAKWLLKTSEQKE